MLPRKPQVSCNVYEKFQIFQQQCPVPTVSTKRKKIITLNYAGSFLDDVLNREKVQYWIESVISQDYDQNLIDSLKIMSLSLKTKMWKTISTVRVWGVFLFFLKYYN